MRFLTVLGSSAEFFSFFVVLTLSLGFWGRLALRLTRIGDRRGYGEPLTLVAGLGWLGFLGVVIEPYTDNFLIFLKLFYYTGLIGAIIEILVYLKDNICIMHDKVKLLRLWLRNNEILIISCILSIIISILYSLLWLSGTVELWMNNGADFYHWVLNADYHLGLFNEKQFNFSSKFYYTAHDSFGTQLVIALIAVINNKSAFLSAPFCIITIFIWFNSIIYNILRIKFGFNWLYSFILIIGIFLSLLPNYLVMYGQFGHFILIICYLTIVDQIDCSDIKHNRVNKIILRIFIPVLVIFMSYQSGYIVFCCLVGLSLFNITFINSNNLVLVKRISKSILLSAIPVLATTLAASILMPGLAKHIVERAGQVAGQTEGWPLPFLGPWLFSGLPFFPSSTLSDFSAQNLNFLQKYIYYPAFIITLSYITLFIFKKKIKVKIQEDNYIKTVLNIYQGRNNIVYIISFSITYLFVLSLYFALFRLWGNQYRIWKFAAYTVLPLSFLPTTLILTLLSSLSGVWRRLVAPLTVLVVGLVFLVRFAFMPPLVYFPIKYYSVYSSVPFLSALYKIKPNINKYKTIIIDIDETSEFFILAEALTDLAGPKFEFINGINNLQQNFDYFRLINDNSVILSTYNYTDIYNGRHAKEVYGEFFLYNHDKLKEIGYATLNSDGKDFKWMFKHELSIKIRLPNKIINSDFIYSINLKIIEGQPSNCQNMQFGFVDEAGRLILYSRDIENLSLEVPSTAAEDGILKSIVIAPQTTGCKYYVESIAVRSR